MARPVTTTRPPHRVRKILSTFAAALLAAPLALVAAPAQAAPSDAELCAAMDMPVYLGYDAKHKRTVMSTSLEEIKSAAQWGYTQNLGVAMYAADYPKPGLEPVYEMVRESDWVRLYVMGEEERDSSQKYGFKLDSVAFYASKTANSCTQGVMRYSTVHDVGQRFLQTANPRHLSYFDQDWGKPFVNFFTRAIPSNVVNSTTVPGSTVTTPAAPTPTPAPSTPATKLPTQTPAAPTEPAPKPIEPTPTPKPAEPAPTPDSANPSPAPEVGGSSVNTQAAKAGADAGAAPIGSARYPIPAGALFVATNGNDSAAGTQAAPLRTLETAVARVKKGQTIVLRGGVYNSQVKFFTEGVTIQNYPGEAVWLDGTAVVTGITKRADGRYQAPWKYEFDNYNGGGTGGMAYVFEHNKMAAWPDQVFVDGKQWTQVESNPGAGQFARDYVNDLIIFGSNPSGEVRASNKAQALFIGGANNTLQGIGVRRYATGINGLGTVYSSAGNFTIRNVHIQDAATNALNLGRAGWQPASLVQDVTIDRPGLAGIGAVSIDKSTIERVLITEANWAGFNQIPGSAGMKILRSRDITIRGNHIVNPDSDGIWLDESNVGFHITNNRVTGGKRAGVQMELSSQGVLADNYFVGNDTGINVYNSHDIDIVNNLVDDTRNVSIIIQQDERKHSDPKAIGHDPRYPAGKDPLLTWIVNNVNVTNNVFGDQDADTFFLVQVRDKTRQRDASQMGARFTGNAFSPITGAKLLVGWGDRKGGFTYYLTLADWQKAQPASASNNISAPNGRSGPQLDDWADTALPVVAWPAKARDYLGRGTAPGYTQVD